MDQAVQCVPAHGAKVMTDGDTAIRNSAMSTAVIDRVALANSKGLRFISAC